MSRLRVVAWFGDYPFQIHQANRLRERFDLVGAVYERRPPARSTAPREILDKGLSRVVFPQVSAAWRRICEEFARTSPAKPRTATLAVPQINCKEVADFTRALEPDLVLVSGTSLVRPRLLAIPTRLGMLNLHTGLSPYVNGGPNCTNWCIANGDFHLIGNTVMWINAGIDAGNLVTTDVTPFYGSERRLVDVYRQVYRHGQELYEAAVDVLERTPERCPNVPQAQVGTGRTFYSREWTLRQHARLARNLVRLKTRLHAPEVAAKRQALTLVRLPT